MIYNLIRAAGRASIIRQRRRRHYAECRLRELLLLGW